MSFLWWERRLSSTRYFSGKGTQLWVSCSEPFVLPRLLYFHHSMSLVCVLVWERYKCSCADSLTLQVGFLYPPNSSFLTPIGDLYHAISSSQDTFSFSYYISYFSSKFLFFLTVANPFISSLSRMTHHSMLFTFFFTEWSNTLLHNSRNPLKAEATDVYFAFNSLYSVHFPLHIDCLDEFKKMITKHSYTGINMIINTHLAILYYSDIIVSHIVASNKALYFTW